MRFAVLNILICAVGFYDQQYQMPFASISQPKLPSSKDCLILSVRLIRTWVVEYFGRKPNCNEYVRLLMSRKLGRLLHMSFLIIFSILDRVDIGL